MKILYVFGYDDYSVYDWEDQTEEFRASCISKLKNHLDKFNFNKNNYIQLLEFPNCKLTDDFLYFLKNTLTTYDEMVHKDFYILEN